MTQWLIETNRKGAWSQDTWSRAGETVTLQTNYRCGSVIVDSDTQPEFALSGTCCITDQFPGYQLNDLEEVISEDWDFVAVDPDTEAEIQQAWEDSGNSGLEDLGWSNTEFEIFFALPVCVKRYTG